MVLQWFVHQVTMLRNPLPCKHTYNNTVTETDVSLVTIFICINVCLTCVNVCVCVCVNRGFCFFNSVAITAKLLQQKLGVGKILIVDWVSSIDSHMFSRP